MKGNAKIKQFSFSIPFHLYVHDQVTVRTVETVVTVTVETVVTVATVETVVIVVTVVTVVHRWPAVLRRANMVLAQASSLAFVIPSSSSTLRLVSPSVCINSYSIGAPDCTSLDSSSNENDLNALACLAHELSVCHCAQGEQLLDGHLYDTGEDFQVIPV